MSGIERGGEGLTDHAWADPAPHPDLTGGGGGGGQCFLLFV